MAYGLLASLCACVRFGGRDVHWCIESDGDSQAYLWLCSKTALHLASERGQMGTALALVKAGSDVHCKNNDGYA